MRKSPRFEGNPGGPPALHSAGSVEELEKLVSGQARLSQDRRQRAALHYAVPRDDGHAPLPVPVHRMTALGPHMGEAD